MPNEGFWTVHSDLPREGPGSPEDVRWALDLARTPMRARICDAACGPGADTETLIEARPQARVEALDLAPHFVEAAQIRCPTAIVEVADYSELSGPYDLIWCAGAAYFMGVTEALTKWRPELAPDGRIAFSEPVWLSDTPSETAREFWEEYPAITDLAGIEDRVALAGFRSLGQRMLVGAPWAAYYDPMQARLDQLLRRADPALQPAIEQAQHEIDLWRTIPDEIAYALLVVEPR